METENEIPYEHYPLVDALDHEILMHRDAHFGGQFPIMLEYYRKEGKGVQPDFSISRIEKLAEMENQMKQNLAALFLEGHEAQQVADAREAYQTLREIYEVQKSKSPYPRLIADLILAEDEEGEEEIAALVEHKDKVVPFLIDLLRNESFHDPLFPGYGLAPLLAVKCLEQIGDKRAIISLFEALGHEDFFGDEQIVKALKAIGQPAKEFLLHVVKGRPINEDNEKGAIALLAFKEEDEVANLCFDLLQEDDVRKDPCLPTYLALICAGLTDPVRRQAFKVMAKSPTTPQSLKKDMEAVIKDWE